MIAPKPCSCWQQVTLHDGDHCCFKYDDEYYYLGAELPCGHDKEGLQINEAYEKSLEVPR